MPAHADCLGSEPMELCKKLAERTLDSRYFLREVPLREHWSLSRPTLIL